MISSKKSSSVLFPTKIPIPLIAFRLKFGKSSRLPLNPGSKELRGTRIFCHSFLAKNLEVRKETSVDSTLRYQTIVIVVNVNIDVDVCVGVTQRKEKNGRC